jgi:hypothetical protein
MTFPADLIPGDILLYHGSTVFNEVTDIKTGGLVDHVEVYHGNGLSVAARPEGFNVYDFELEGLVQVRRPVNVFDIVAADTWLMPLRGVSYDTPGLLEFFNVEMSNNGFICSVGAAYYLKMGHCKMFADDYPLVKISPRDFELTREAITIYNSQT